VKNEDQGGNNMTSENDWMAYVNGEYVKQSEAKKRVATVIEQNRKNNPLDKSLRQ
jgi:hypothetical protein